MNAPKEFNGQTRLADDRCSVTQKDIQSVGPGTYNLTTEHRGGFAGPTQKKAANIALANPTMTYGVGYGSATAATIDDESILRNHTVQTHDARCGGRIQPRPFLTVPLMSRGKGSPDVESRLQHGELVRTNNECGSVTELQFPVFTPLIPKMAANVQDPKNLITESAAPGWIHGGLPSRQYARDADCVRSR